MNNTLVIGSGGIKGFAFLGVCKMLEQRNLISTCKYFIGCSIGSIICLGLACGCSCSDLLSEFLNKEFQELIQKAPLEDMISKMGVFDKSLLRKFVVEFVEKQLRITDAEQMTFREFSEITERDFYCITTDIDNYETKIHGLKFTPDEPCIEAVISSCSIPFVFQGTEVPKGFLVDGAIMDPVGLKVAFQISPPGTIIYSTFFAFKRLGRTILETVRGKSSEDDLIMNLWQKALEKSPPPPDHVSAKDSSLFVNIFSHGQRMYKSYMESLVENYVFRHIYENKLRSSPYKLRLIPLPNLNVNVLSSPETKVDMYFDASDMSDTILKSYGL